MKLKRNDSTPEGKDFWAYVDSVVKEVKTWPNWMRGDRAAINRDTSTASVDEDLVKKKKRK